MCSSAQAFAGTNLDTSYRASSSRRTSAFLFPLVANANVANGGEREARRCWLPKKPRAYARRPGAETKAHPSSNQSCPRWRDLTGKHGIQDENWRRPFPKKFPNKKTERCCVFLLFCRFNLHFFKTHSRRISRIYGSGRGYRFDPLRFPELSHTYCDQTWQPREVWVRWCTETPIPQTWPSRTPNITTAIGSTKSKGRDTWDLPQIFGAMFFFNSLNSTKPDTPTKNRRQLRGETENVLKVRTC